MNSPVGASRRRGWHLFRRARFAEHYVPEGKNLGRQRRLRFARCILLVVALSFYPGPAVGTIFSVPLPDLVGVVDFPTSGPGREASFDFGQRFSEIQNVSIEVEAQVFAREFDVCGTVFDPQPCVHVVQLLGFLSIMDDEDSPIIGFVFSDGLSFSDDFRDLEGAGVDVAPFNNPLVGWDFLLDGEGSLTLFWNRRLGNPDRIIQNLIAPSGEIFNARLIIEATPIPEPSTSLLLAAGLLVLTGTRRFQRRRVHRHRTTFPGRPR